MSSEQTDESSDPSPPAPNVDGTETPANGRSAGKRSLGIAEASGYSTVLIVIGLISGVIGPPANLILAGIGAVFALLYYLWRYQRPPLLHTVVILLAVALGFFSGYVGRPLIHSAWGNLTGECDDPVELTVLLPEDGAQGFEEAISGFNDQYLDESDCKRANVTAYSARWPDVQKALELGWNVYEELDEGEPRPDFIPQRDVGPRPDLLLAESAAQVQSAEDLLNDADAEGVLDADEAAPIGSTPLVVAVPDDVFNKAFNPNPPEGEQAHDQVLGEDENLSGLVERLGDEHRLPVVRSDPKLSYTALLFVKYLYGTDPDAVGVQIEKQLARSAENLGLGLPGTDTGLICDLAQISLPDPGTAILTTERALARYNLSTPLEGGCLNSGSRPAYSPVYLTGLGSLDYRTARLHWEDPWAERRSAVAEDLTEWLAGEGDWSPEAIGIRGNGYDGTEINGGQNFALGFRPEGEPLAEGEPDELLAAYSASRVPTNVLLAIDSSLTMGTQISGEGRSRFELAVEGVRAALANLGPDDAAGLWTFPAEGDDAHDDLLAIGEGRGPQDADRLADQPLVDGVDLHQTLVDGIGALEAAGKADEEEEGDGVDEESVEDDSVEAMVVLTDGDDRDDSDVTVGDVVDRVAESEVSLYIIAVGDASCRAGNFADMTKNPRIRCLDAEEDQIKTTFDSLFGQLWS